jgi:cytochrome c oxidase assembly factor CtaG
VRRTGVAALGASAGALVLAAPAAAHHPLSGTGRFLAWDLAPTVLVAAGLALGLFFYGVWRLRGRGRADLAGLDRIVLFTAGLSIVVLALVSPIDAIGEQYLLSAHMLQHMAIADAGPALMLFAVRGPLLFFVLPAALLGPIARSPRVRAAVGFLVRPIVALTIWCAVFAVWHVPSLYEKAITDAALHDLEHISYLLAGLLLWTVLIDPAQHNRVRRSVRIAVAVAVLIAGQVLAEILLFSSGVYYPLYELQPDRLLGLSPLTDQRYAGAVMMVEQALAIGTFLLVFFLAEDEAARRRQQGGPSALEPAP